MSRLGLDESRDAVNSLASTVNFSASSSEEEEEEELSRRASRKPPSAKGVARNAVDIDFIIVFDSEDIGVDEDIGVEGIGVEDEEEEGI